MSEPTPVRTTASWPRRILALVVDWLGCMLVLFALTQHWAGHTLTTLALFWLEATLGTWLLGASFGQWLCRVRVAHLDGRRLNLLEAAVRSVLICLAVPPLIFRSEDGRGLHDLATDSAAFPR